MDSYLEKFKTFDEKVKFIVSVIMLRSKEATLLETDFYKYCIDNLSTCDYNDLKKSMKYLVNLIDNNLSKYFYIQGDNMPEMEYQFSWMYLYYFKLQEFFEKKYTIFTLGSSLEKPNFVWNTLMEKNKIIEIPLSGTMYNYFNDPINNSSSIELDENKKKEMIDNFPLLLENNENFRKLIDILKEGKKKVLITDVKITGRSLLSFLELLSHYNINISKLHFLLITNNYDGINGFDKQSHEEFILLRTKFSYHIPILYLNSTRINSYIINGEEYNSRCLALYKPSTWNKPPAPVFFSEELDQKIEDNKFYTKSQLLDFLNCNMHKFLFILFSSCFFQNFFIPNYDKKYLPVNISDLEKNIRLFISNNSNKSSTIIIKNKYLKYKLKYLELKKTII
jgi:hypothetical protein